MANLHYLLEQTSGCLDQGSGLDWEYLEDLKDALEESIEMKSLLSRLYIARNITLDPKSDAWTDLDRHGRKGNTGFN